uniref:Uncharacterized protein n=1 Tax=Oryza glumipatula TaxID=40148 RepID=A0A0E0BLU9_9ORYZ
MAVGRRQRRRDGGGAGGSATGWRRERDEPRALTSWGRGRPELDADDGRDDGAEHDDISEFTSNANVFPLPPPPVTTSSASSPFPSPPALSFFAIG